MNFLCGFFLINSLWIPPLSIPTLVRMYTWFIIGNMVFKEGYVALQQRNDPQTRYDISSPNLRFVTYAIVVLEIAISFKYDRDTGNLTDETMHPVTFYGWLITFIIIAGYYSYLRWIRKTDEEFEDDYNKSIASSSKKNSSKKKR